MNSIQIGRQLPVLDHGYVTWVEAWGTGLAGREQPDPRYEQKDADYEVGIIEAARQSVHGSFRGWDPAECDCGWDPSEGDGEYHSRACATKLIPGDARLLKYLYNNNHASPFEFAGMVIEVQAPIMVFREWHRHRTQSYNEMSARYVPLPDLYYVPDYNNVVDRARLAQHTTNKQMKSAGTEPWADEQAGEFLEALENSYDDCERVYKVALKKGIPKEIARLVMPVGHYSRMRAAGNLRNWLAFMTLRCDPNAQWEIRQYAQKVGEIVARAFPRTHQLWKARESA